MCVRFLQVAVGALSLGYLMECKFSCRAGPRQERFFIPKNVSGLEQRKPARGLGGIFLVPDPLQTSARIVLNLTVGRLRRISKR